jgi:nitrite reductase/ring-hydroxylating ferredoxin subunit
MIDEARGGGEVDDPRARLDIRIDTPGREGLTGTAAANIYRRLQDREQITLPPDGRPMDEQPAWRTDFPIDWPQDQYVERRDFMKFLVLTSLALTVGQFWLVAQNWWRRRSGRPEIARVAAVADVPVGGVLTFAYPEAHDDSVLVRTGDATFVAYSQKCTHLACAVRPRVDEGIIHCPCHEGIFDLGSGRPLAGPPRRPLPLVHLEVRGGQIYATGVEERTV